MQQNDTDRQHLFNRRAALLVGGQALMVGALVGRLYYLQILEGDRYRLLADENRIHVRLIAPRRGRIVDRFGLALADNEQNYQVLLIAENTSDVETTLNELAEIIDLDAAAVARILDEVDRHRDFVPVTVAEFLAWEDVARIEVNTLDLPGISIDVGQRRFYPEGQQAAHVLGYVARVSEEDLNGDPLLEIPGFRIGRTGIERRYDEELRGAAGSRQLEVNATGRVVRELERDEATRGGDVVLAVDLAVQRFASERLGEESGAVTVMDIHTGEVHALASTPSFDPNMFTEGLSIEQWRTLADDERAPLRNKAIAGEFAPGSTFKLAVALAGLDEGAIGPATHFTCPGYMQLGNRRFHCWKRGGHGRIGLADAIIQSCDVYFYEVAHRLGIDRIAETAVALGLGSEVDIGIPGERPGLVPTRAWKRAVIGEPWVGGEDLISGIGQGFLLTTPIQLAVMTARLANGGLAVRPRLVSRAGVRLPDRLPEPGPDGTVPNATILSGEAGEDGALEAVEAEEVAPAPSLGFNPRHLELIRQAMVAVTTSPRGTAYRARIGEGEMEMAGKTGTVQVRRISIQERETGVLRNQDIDWRLRDHAIFVGFGPIGAPKYSISVVVEHGGGGSSVAAPIARDVMALTLRRDRALGFAGAPPGREG